MGRGAIFSGILHVLAVAIAVVGLPVLWNRDAPVDQPILVELMVLSSETSAPLQKPAPKPEAKPEPPEAKPTPPEAVAQPVQPAPQPAPTPEPKAAPVEKVALLPSADKPKPAEAPPREPAPVPQSKPTPPRRVEEKPVPAPQTKPKAPDLFASVLRSVEELRKETPKETASTKDAPPPAAARAPSLDQRLTMSELDSIRRQFEACWSLPAGARDAQNLVVDVWVSVSPEGGVRQARVVEAERMARDPFYRAAAESALRAVLNPRCNPLKLPPGKYEQWKTFTLSFNPKDMF